MAIGQYIFAHVDAGLSWTQAKALASSLGGQLASVTTAQEDAFVRSVLSNSGALNQPDGANGLNGVWIGLSQAGGSTEPGGGWVWESSEAFDFTAWHVSKPDNSLNGDKALYWRSGGTVGWSDSVDNPVIDPDGTGRVPDAAIELSATKTAISGTSGDDYIICSAVKNTVSGGAGSDKIEGRSGDDTIRGGAGSDFLLGGLGNDSLSGQAGNDLIYGGSGRDVLTGGTGFDTFDFNKAGETKVGVGKRDIISKFVQKATTLDPSRDFIDLSGIDGNTKIAGAQAFKFIGKSAFHKKAGELHYVQQNKTGTKFDLTIIQGDTNGDGRVDFEIELKGLYKLSSLDFVLSVT